MHQATLGKAALDVSEWPGVDLEQVIVDAKRHARSLGKARQGEANEMLLRGAVLHADIASLIPETIEQQSKKQQLIFLVEDGREQGTRFVSIHWELGRSLLDSVAPTPAAHSGVLHWYQQTSKDLLRLRSLAEALVHLSKARRIFPADPDLQFMSGVLHERLSSPALQAAAKEVEADNTKLTSLDAARVELARAEQFFRDSLTLQPDNLEARVRRGRVLGRLGRHRQSADVLREAIQRGVSGEFLYLAQMFLATQEEALGNYAEARTHYEHAASLYPRAQSPRLALSQLSRRFGDRASAQRELGVLAQLPVDEGRREDPWWNYYDYR